MLILHREYVVGENVQNAVNCRPGAASLKIVGDDGSARYSV